jgi:hypothetical protein
LFGDFGDGPDRRRNALVYVVKRTFKVFVVTFRRFFAAESVYMRGEDENRSDRPL